MMPCRLRSNGKDNQQRVSENRHATKILQIPGYFGTNTTLGHYPASPSLFVGAGFGNRRIVVQPSLEGIAGHLVECGSTRFRAAFSLGADIAQRDTAMFAYEIIGHLSRIEEMDQVRPRHAEQFCRTLCHELLFFWQQHHSRVQ
jgi:hypothetical protein